MKNEIIFGAAYYPEYIPFDRTAEDIAMMKAAGMNAIRIAESTWSTLEPEEGIYDFSYIDRVLDEAMKQDMQVIIGTPTYAIPSWLSKKDEEILAQTQKKKNLYGHRQLMDITNATFLTYAEKIIRKLLEHTAGHPRVIGFQIDNETKHYDVAGKNVQDRFICYLKEKYGTTDNLNKTFGLAYWSNAVHSWEDFPDMRGCVNGGLVGEFEWFRRNLVTEYLSWQAGIVEEYRRKEQFITHNLDFEWRKFGADIAQDGYSYGVQPDVHHQDVAECLTIAGTDIYHPSQDELTGAETAFCGDEIRSLKKQPYLVLETQAQAFKYWTPYPGQLRQQAYSHLASGAIGSLYWNWHSIHNGYETYWKGVLSHDLASNPVYEEAAAFGKEWKTFGAQKLLIRKKNRIALVIDNLSLTAFQWFPIDKDLSYNDVVRWMYDSLYELNLECDVVFADRLRPSDYDMIVVPALYCAKESLLWKLEEFVQEGGILVASFKSFFADEHSSVYTDTQPHVLHKCFGISYNQFTEPGRTTLNGEKVSYFAELLKPEGAKVLHFYEHPYWKDYAAITQNDYGRGKAYYVGCYTTGNMVKEILREAASSAGISLPLAEAPVIIRSGVNGLYEKVHYVFHYSDHEGEFTCPYDTVKDLLTGKCYCRNETIFLKDWDVKILIEKQEIE